jgi:hypothetical protein
VSFDRLLKPGPAEPRHVAFGRGTRFIGEERPGLGGAARAEYEA